MANDHDEWLKERADELVQKTHARIGTWIEQRKAIIDFAREYAVLASREEAPATPPAAIPAAPGEVTPKVWDCAQCGKPIHGPIVLGETAGAFHPACRTPAPLGERAGFEAAISKAMPDVMPLVRNFDDYQRVGTQMAWWAWQTRAALKGEQPAQRKEGA